MTQAIEPSAIPARAEDVLATQSQDVAVLMSMNTGKFIELNETARAIWELTDGSTPVADVVERLCEQFEVTREKCTGDVAGLYARMSDEGLIVFSD